MRFRLRLWERPPSLWGYQVDSEPPHPEIRSHALWLAALRPAERDEWNQHNRVTIHGSDGRTYMIIHRGSYNVIDTQARIALCAIPDPEARLPSYDALLAQKLLLETDASLFRRIAFMALLRPPEFSAMVG